MCGSQSDDPSQHDAFNRAEDERIEALLREDYPAWAAHMAAVREAFGDETVDAVLDTPRPAGNILLPLVEKADKPT